MVGKSPVRATLEQRAGVKAMAGGGKGPGGGAVGAGGGGEGGGGGGDRAEADRARAVLLTLSGWTSARIAEAFGVREDTVRLWRSDFLAGGVEALKARVAPGPLPVKADAALKVAGPLLGAPVADRTNWTLARLAEEIERREGG